jgi:CRISPR-associated protein Csb2
MLTIEVELLTGRYAATSHHDRSRAEWPPHPARFFSALVAALHSGGGQHSEEREALLWLERQPPPSLRVDLEVTEEIGRRMVLDVFVPVNDITLVGDPEKPLRDARAASGLVNIDPSSKKEIARTRKAVEKEEAKLAAFLQEQGRIDPDPSAVSLNVAKALMPTQRTRQVRTFPVVVPTTPTFAFMWTTELPPQFRAPLERLCDRVTRLGHSSSLVRCVIAEKTIEPTLVPDDDAGESSGSNVLRVVSPGQLDRLETDFARHQGVESRILPSRPQRYRRWKGGQAPPIPPRSVFSDEWIIFERAGGARPLSSRGTDAARALRDALLEEHGSSDLSGFLSGHTNEGQPFEGPHLAFVALPYVGYEHADASIQGVAIIPPCSLPRDDREVLLRLIARWESRTAREQGTLELSRGTLRQLLVRRVDVPEKAALNPSVWCRASRRFVTATPIALDKNPGNLRSNIDRTAERASIEAQRAIADACLHIGLPSPVRVEVSLSPLLRGTQPLRDFAPWPGQTGRTSRVRVYAEIEFEERVRGPVLLGAGRYFGLGLCFPVA